MAPKFEDLKSILPDQLKLSDRKMQIWIFGTIGALSLICIVLAVITGLHAGGQIVPLGNPAGSGPEALTSKACMTLECLETSSRLRRTMDSSIDPCTNFHQYACGSWGKTHSIPPNKADMTVIDKLRDDNSEKFRELLETKIRRRGINSSERKLKEFFAMCVHDYGRMQDAGTALIGLIQQHIKGWYALDPDNWKDQGWDLNTAIADVQGQLDVDVMLKFNVDIMYSTSEHLIRISQGGTGMYYTYYMGEDNQGIQDAYKDYMRTVGSLLIRDANITLDGSELEQRVEQFVNDAYGQEQHLAQLRKLSNSDTYQIKTKKTTLGELETSFTQLPWRQILQQTFQGFEPQDSTKVRIWPYAYFQMVDQLLRNETTDKDRIMNNYIVWQIASIFSPYLSWEYKHASFRYYETAYGYSEFPSTWEDCVFLVSHKLPSALAAEYVKGHTDVQSKSQVENIYQYVQTALNDSIDHVHWMDNITQTRAKQKVGSVKKTIGFPDSYFDDTYLDELHSKLVVNKTQSFFQNLINVERFQRYLKTQELKAGVHGVMWRFVLSWGGARATPAYHWMTNYMLVSPGAMQPPLFVKNNPGFMNFGGIGEKLAEELSASISQLGRNFWINGSQIDWWTQDTYNNYNKAKTCFENYFMGTKVGPYLVNGENLTVEIEPHYETSRIIELHSALRTSLKAYQNWIKNNGAEQMPVGLDMTPDQAYFLATAQTQCYVRTPETSYYYAYYQFMPEDVMFNGVLSHMKEFADAFQCGIKTPMVANETCYVF